MAETPEQRAAAKLGARHALWRVGDLSWALHARQIEDEQFIEDCRARGIRRVVLLCGRRYGKTRLLVVRAFQKAIRNPGGRIPYAAKTWESALAYVIPEARYLIANAPPELTPKIVGDEIRFPNTAGLPEAVIKISGSHTVANADNLRGPDSIEANVDEAAFNDVLDYLCNDVLQAQLIKTDGMMLIASSAPESPSHPYVAHMKRAKLRGALVKRKTSDAPHLTPAAIDAFAEEIGGKGSTTWAREAECEIVTDENRAVIPEWRHHGKRCVGEVEPRQYRHFYLSADLGYNDGTAVLLGWVDWYGADVLMVQEDGSEVLGRTGPRLVVVGERILERPTSFDVQAAASELEREHGAVGKVRARVADAQAITVADLRRLHGKLRDEVGDAAAWRLPRKDDLEGAVNHVRLMVKRGQLVISPSCTRLLDDVNDAVWNLGRTKFEQVSETWHYDALAALVYLCRTADLQLCPEPAVWMPTQARKPHPGDRSVGTLPSRINGNRVSLRRQRR